MDALLMCGGIGTRLQTDVEKPMLEIHGTPMIERVLSALESSDAASILPVATPNVPATQAYLERHDYGYLESPGDGYVTDLNYALDYVTQPVLTVATDLPLLHQDVVNPIIQNHDSGSLTVAVPLALKRVLDLSHDTTLTHQGRAVAPTGVNIVSRTGEDTIVISHDIRLAVNVNHPSDVKLAERLG